MNEPTLFTLALFAMKADPNHPAPDETPAGIRFHFVAGPGNAESHHYYHQICLVADGVLAETEEEAKRMGLEKVRQLCPPSDGWCAHKVNAMVAVNRELVMQMVEAIKGSALPKEKSRSAENSDLEWPDTLL